MRFLLALFLIVHGLVHLAIYLPPHAADQQAPFDPARSWALGAAHVGAAALRATSVTFALTVAAVYSTAGWLLIADTARWSEVTVLGALLALVLKIVWFNRWLTLGVALDVAVIAAVTSGQLTLT